MIRIISNLTEKNGKYVREGDTVRFCGYEGKIVFDCGCLGVTIDEGIDYSSLQKFMNEHEDICHGNDYSGCENDNFISLWELYWNFNCIENYLWMLEII